MFSIPKRTVVKITGNSRTSDELIDRIGVVWETPDSYLGGWHIVELIGGTRVKIQKNALTVIDSAGVITNYRCDDRARGRQSPQRSSFE